MLDDLLPAQVGRLSRRARTRHVGYTRSFPTRCGEPRSAASSAPTAGRGRCDGAKRARAGQASTGAQQIFASHGLSLLPDQASLLTKKTEGWPAGIYLAALIARDGGSEALAISGEDPYVADFLYDEALSQLSDGVRAFLRRTSILEELSAPLCEAVALEAVPARPSASSRTLASFLVPLDRRREWFRYHDLSVSSFNTG